MLFFFSNPTGPFCTDGRCSICATARDIKNRLEMLSVLRMGLQGPLYQDSSNKTWQLQGAIVLTYLLTPWSIVLLEKLTGFAASQEIPRTSGTRRFITVLTSARHLSLSSANSIQSPQPPPTSWKSILILSSHLRLVLPNGLFPSDFPTRTLCTPLSSPICAACPAHFILLDFTTRTIFGKEYRSLSSSLWRTCSR